MKTINKRLNINRVFLHTLFWLVSVLGFAFMFRLSETVDRLDIAYSLFFHLTIIGSVYLNFLGLKKLFKKGHYFKYLMLALIIITLMVILNLYTFNVLIDLILPDYYFVSQFNFLEIGIITLTYLGVTSSIKFSKSWFDLQRVNQRIIESEKERIDTELQSLKSQINPHFLFNSLNVIYSLTLKNDQATPEVVLKLSDILRYVIYDSTREKVLLSSELSLLKKYIDLQRYRVEEEASINLISEIDYDAKIAPLIFLTLLENSFKHGIKSDIENVFINVKIRSNAENIYFEIENNKQEIEPNTQKQKGVGLENIRKRLALQYPDKHEFKVIEIGNTFKVYLEIKHES